MTIGVFIEPRLESSPRSQVPLFGICLSYAFHTNTFFISLVVLSYPCSILVTRLTTKLNKIYLVYTNHESVPNLKKICKTSKRCTRYIECVSFLVRNCLFLSYASHIAGPVITFSCSAECSAKKIQLVIELQFNFRIPQHSIHQAQQDLFATRAPAGSFARLWLGRPRSCFRPRSVLLRGGRRCRGRQRWGRRR